METLSNKYKVDISTIQAQIAKITLNEDENSRVSAQERNVAEAEDGYEDAASDTEKSRLRKQLVNPNEQDKEELVGRISELMDKEGKQIIFSVGVEDDGAEMNLTDKEIEQVSKTLEEIVKDERIKATCTKVYQDGEGAEKGVEEGEGVGLGRNEKKGGSKNQMVYYLIRRRVERVEDVVEVRMAIMGNVDAGKSTVLGVLTRNKLDNGRGSARSSIFRHRHEQETGRTSSIGMEVMGFDRESGEVISSERKLEWNEICKRAAKVIVFQDLAGHEKYLRTTVFGLAGGQPEYGMLVVGSNAGMIGMAKEHLGLCIALNIPVFVVITKIDMSPANVQESTVRQVVKVLKSAGSRKQPMLVRTTGDAVLAAMQCGTAGSKRCPIFQISSVDGRGMEQLRVFLNLVPASREYSRAASALLEIRETFSVPFVGTVVSGVVRQGVISAGDTMQLGPDEFGRFGAVQVKSLHYNRVNVPVVYAGQSASLNLKKVARSSLRKGMILTAADAEPRAYWRFEAEVLILYHTTTISPNYQAVLHCRAVRQTARVVQIRQEKVGGDEALRTGDRARVVFRFLQRPEYLEIGSKIIFREGRTRGVGKIVELLTE